MIGNQWKPIGEALIDGEVIETGVPLKARDYDVTIADKDGEMLFTITRKKADKEG